MPDHGDLRLNSMLALQALGRRAGWSEFRIAARIQEVGDYLDLPSAPADSKGRETRNLS